MKKSLVLFFFACMIFPTIHAQSVRMLLAEEFTSATCGPCASQNPAFDALLKSNTDKITSIKYHMSWPAPGNDPMYLHNTVDNNARRTYYNVNSVPHVHLNGNLFNGMPSQITQTMLNNYANQPAVFDVALQHRLSAGNDSIYITMIIKANQAVTGNLVAHIAVIEKEIHFTSAPGTNGEKDFYNVMKALLPSKNGTSLPNFEANQYMVVEAAWKLANVYNIDQLAAVGFVQNVTTKQVYQAANSTAGPLVPFFANDAEVKSIVNGNTQNCSGTMKPKALIVNNGQSPLTSATVEFSINGQVLKTINWTGSLAFREKALIEAGTLEFALLNTNELIATVTQVNGVADDYTENNYFSLPFTAAPILTQPVSLYLVLNNKPTETSWELRNSNGEVIQSGGPYTTPGSIITEPLNMPQGSCYEFVMKDSGGNGLCCGDGIGFYAILEGNSSNPVYTGQSFGYEDHNEISYGYVGINENLSADEFQLMPNPTSNAFSFKLSLQNPAHLSLDIFDLSGRLMMNHQFGLLEAGTHTLTQSVRQLKKGMYMVRIESGNEVKTSRLFVE